MKMFRLEEVDSYLGEKIFKFVPTEQCNDDCITLSDLRYLYSGSESMLANQIVAYLKQKSKTLSCAESLTGGLVSSAIVSVSGASSVFEHGLVCYSNNAKQKFLNVSHETLQQYGAVSAPVAKQMALGVIGECDFALSTTGIAGPSGDGICEKVGTVFIAVCSKSNCVCLGFKLDGDRQQIRQSAVNIALSMLYTLITLEKI